MKRYERDYVTLMEVLANAQAQRSERREWRGQEVGWVIFVREVMHAAVNEIRAERDMPPVDLAAICVAEERAVGYVDYTKKFALECERLTQGEAAVSVADGRQG